MEEAAPDKVVSNARTHVSQTGLDPKIVKLARAAVPQYHRDQNCNERETHKDQHAGISDSSISYLCLRIDRSDTTVGNVLRKTKISSDNQDPMQGVR